jgi:hypothetical protein
VETSTLRLTGRTLRRWRIDNGAAVADVIRDVCTNAADRTVAGAQPNYLYALAQSQQEPINSAQYAPEKLKLVDAHRLADGDKVLVAAIDPVLMPTTRILWGPLPPVSMLPRPSRPIPMAPAWRAPSPRTATCWALRRESGCLRCARSART